MKNMNKCLRFMMIAMAAVLMPAMAFASSPLYVSDGDITGFKAYDTQGKSIGTDQMLSDGLYEGWIVRTDASVVALGSPAGTIVLQPQTILGVSKLTYEDPVFYLISGAAIFQTDADFNGTLNVATPVSRYQVSGTSQIWISSDLGELIYSFGGSVTTLNVITKQQTTVPPYYYLDMMIPLMDPKPVNQQAYMSMAYNPDPVVAANLPGTPPQPIVTSVVSKPVEEPVVEPEVPATPAEPVATVEPAAPSAPVEPVAIVEPVAPAAPAEPVATVEPTTPAAPAVPAEPTAPIATVKPIATEPKIPSAPVFSDIIDMSPLVPDAPLFTGTAEIKPLFPEAPIFASLPAIRRLAPNAPAFKPTKISYYQPRIQVMEEPQVIPEVEPIVEEPIEESVQIVEEDKLTVRQPSGVISGAAPEKARIDAGVALAYSLHYDGSQNPVQPLSTIAIKPYFSYNTFKLGLQATVSTTGSLNWNDLGGSLKFDTSSPLRTIASLTSFIDYFKFGTTAGKVYFNVDTTSPISFGVNSMMGGVNHRFDKTSMLGFYNQVNTSWYSHQIYFDDLYLNRLNVGGTERQTGGVRFSFTPTQSYPFSIGISSLVVLSNPSDLVVDLYPSLDFSFPLVNNRKLRMNLNIGGALYLQATPNFDISTIYDKNGATFFSKFPNLLASAGIDATFGGAKLGATLAFNRGAVVSNLINNTSYSGKPMTSGDVLDVMLNGSYTAGGFQISGSWNVPLKISGTFGLAPLVNDTNGRKADISTLELGYTGNAWSFGAGIQQIDMIGAYTALFTGAGNASDKIGAFLDPDYTNTYAYAAYDTGAVRLDLKLSTAKAVGQTNMDIAPVLDLGMTMRLGTGTVSQFGESTLLTKDSKIKISGSLGATYVNRRFSTTPADKDSGDQLLFIKPTLLLDSNNFSMGIGINFGTSLGYHTFFDPNAWYAPRGDKFWDFGLIDTGNLSTGEKIFDLVTDVFNLVEHLRIGKPLSSFYLIMDRERALSFADGTLVDNILPNIEAPYFTALPLYNRLNTRYFGYELFIDDMTFPTLAGLSLAAKPTATSYPFSVGVSAVAQSMHTFYDMKLYPSVDITLPIIYNKGLDKMSVGIHAATAVQLKTNENKFLLLDSNKKLRNYLMSASLDGTFSAFDFTIAGGIQSGLLSYGMFDEYYLRRNTTFVGDETVARAFFGKVEFGYSSEVFSIHTGYLLDFDLPGFKSFDYVGDKFNMEMKVRSSVVDVSVGFAKQDIFNEVKGMISSKPTIATGLKDFFVSEDAVVYGQLDVKAGLATLTSRFSTTEAYDVQGNPTGTIKPTLSMGIKIGF